MDWHEHFIYDETSFSCLRWRRFASNNRIKPLTPVGKDTTTNKRRGYYRVHCTEKSYAVHRIIWEMFNGPLKDGEQIDHINGDTLDNRICNLRIVDNRTNCWNQAKRKTNKSGVTGVHLTDNGRGRLYWVAAWMEDNRRRGKMFSVDKYGNDESFRLACEYRAEVVERLKSSGINISERHGK